MRPRLSSAKRGGKPGRPYKTVKRGKVSTKTRDGGVNALGFGALMLRSAGWSVAQVAQAYGVSCSSIKRWCDDAKDEYAEVCESLPVKELLQDRLVAMQPLALNVIMNHLQMGIGKEALEAAKMVLVTTGIVQNKVNVIEDDLAERDDAELIAEAQRLIGG